MSALYLVDGSFELFRCFYGAPRAERADGQPVGAARGLVHTLTSLLRQDDLTHVAIAFDNLFARGGRDADDTEIVRRQYPLALDICRALGIRLWAMNSRYQADDALACAAARFVDDDRLERLVICSADNDFAQCVRGDRVVVWNRIRDRWWAESDVVQKFGVAPQRIPDYLALVGDRSDGIPGLPGFGSRGAAQLINRFGRIEDIPAKAADWDVDVRGAAKLAAMLQQRRQEAVLYRNLSVRGGDVPLPDCLDDLLWTGAIRESVEAMAETLDDPSLLERTIRFRT